MKKFMKIPKIPKFSPPFFSLDWILILPEEISLPKPPENETPPSSSNVQNKLLLMGSLFWFIIEFIGVFKQIFKVHVFNAPNYTWLGVIIAFILFIFLLYCSLKLPKLVYSFYIYLQLPDFTAYVLLLFLDSKLIHIQLCALTFFCYFLYTLDA